MHNDQQQPVGPPQAGPTPPPDDGRAADVVRHVVDDAYQTDTNPYHRTHQDNFDWRQYHSAWQDYYQRYYHNYYEQQVEAHKQTLAASPQVVTGQATPPRDIELSAAQKLKTDVLDAVKRQASKVRRSHHFIPILSGLAVGLIFLFLQFNSVLFAQVQAYVSPGAIDDDALVLDPASVNVGKSSRLIIPKINVDVPVDYNLQTFDEDKIQVSLRDGATHYRLPGADAVPGQKGNTVILGHSSNDIFNQGAYKFVFVLLDRLKVGDTFYLHYKGTRYIYRVSETKVISPTDIGALQTGTVKPTATLVTCTPPGTATNRLIVLGEQISPDPHGAKVASKPTDTTSAKAIPGNERSVLETIWDFFF